MSQKKQRQRLMEHYDFSEKDLKRLRKWAMGNTPKKWLKNRKLMRRKTTRYEQVTNEHAAILFPTND